MVLWLRRILIGLLLIYVLSGFVAWVSQDSMIYVPDQTPVEAVALNTDRYRQIETPDGESLLIWYAQAEQDCPTILFLHGNGGHIGRAQPIHEAITERTGGGLLAVSWRGYTGSTGTPSQDGLVIDALAGFEWLVRNGVAETDIIVHGMSLGTYPATRVAAERPVGFLVLEAPYESVLSVAEGRLPIFPVSLLLRDHYRTDQVIGAVEEPIYIGHGQDDRIIAPVESERLIEHAPAGAGRFLFADGGHKNRLQNGMMEQVIAPAIIRHYPRCRAIDTHTQPLQGEA
jgi:fermentation-respiration switch protein FrsA (DUF1100 family)